MDLDALRTLCKKLPYVEEDIKWGNDLCFVIAGKMFCVAGLEPPLKISLKVLDEQFDELTSTRDIVPAPYVARYKWILIENPNRFSKKEWEKYIKQSYELVKAKIPNKTLKEHGISK